MNITLGSRMALPMRSSTLSNPSKRRVVTRAANFDESAAQVRRLLDRDRKDTNFDDLAKVFEDPAKASDIATSNEVTPTSPKPGVSPFGPSSTTTPASPFGASGMAASRKPSIEPAGMSPTMQPAEMQAKPWWTKITLTQIVIVLSFTTIISLMIATFYVVLSVGAVHFNDS